MSSAIIPNQEIMNLLQARMRAEAQVKARSLDLLSPNEKFDILCSVHRAANKAFKAHQNVLANAPATLTPGIDQFFALLQSGANPAQLQGAHAALQAQIQALPTQPAANRAQQEIDIMNAADYQFRELCKTVSLSEQVQWNMRWLQNLHA